MPQDEPAQWIVPTTGAKTLPAVEILTGRGFITGKSGSGKSVLEGTPVYTKGGRKPIEDVDRGEFVLSLNRYTYEQEFREVQATLQHTDDQLIRIELEDGTELVGTEDHSFLTAHDQEIVPIQGSDVEPGTWMPLSRELPGAETVDRIDLADYRTEANGLVIEEEVIRSSGRTEPRHRDLDFEFGWVIGLYLAEGSFDSHETIPLSTLGDDVRTFLDDWGFNVYGRTCSMGFRPLALFLESEFGVGSGGKRIAPWVYNAPAEFRSGLVSGYIDGDGTVGSDAVTAMSKSPALIDGLSELLRQFGISTTVRDKSTVYAGSHRQEKRLRVDSFTVPRFATVVDLQVTAKADRLRALCDQLETGEPSHSKDMIPTFGPALTHAARERGWTERGVANRSIAASVHHFTRKQKTERQTYNRMVADLDIEGRTKAFGTSDIQWKRVVSVERLTEERTVYDLDVKHNDNFVANGVFVHNSNTGSVIAEELLDNGYNLLIVDPEGEYYGLKESYEILHVGNDDLCDVQVGPQHAEKLAEIALERNVPVVLDVSDYLDAEAARELIAAVVEHLYHLEKDARKPFLVMVEEMQEYLPQSGGSTELSQLLERVAKRGRKRGIGLLGMSQRPAAVDKDFITQCDWMVWHRLNWKTDLDVVRNILGAERAAEIEDFETGEAYLMTDWDDAVERVKFKRKRTHDAGATPGLESYERPDLKSVGSDLIREIRGESGQSSTAPGPDPQGPTDGPTLDDLESAAGTMTTDQPATATPDAGGGAEVSIPDVDTQPEPVDVAVDDLAALEDAELREVATAIVRRNRVLEDEIRELRSILEGLDRSAVRPADRPATSNGSGRPTVSPDPPTPPGRPPERTGVGGNLLELMEMTTFLARVLKYKLAMTRYRWRLSGRPDRDR